MKHLINFIKGIVVGIGGIAPGLSGSVMLILLNLYEKVVNAIGTLFKDFKNNVIYLVPIVLGFGCGALLFSKVLDFFLVNYEFETRFLFLGLVLGTVPLFYRQVTKQGFSKKHLLYMAFAMCIGLFLFYFNQSMFPKVVNPSLLQSFVLGIAVAGSSIVPGVDSAVILSALGLYELYVSVMADVNFAVLIPAAFGVLLGALVISAFMNFLIKRFYTATFSVTFGLFITIIPKVLTSACTVFSVLDIIKAILLVLLGFIFSFYFEDIKVNNQRIKKFFCKLKNMN